jgi:uncharacterized protein
MNANNNAKISDKIRFSCLRCGACCKVGFIYLKKGEADTMARSLAMPVTQFKKKYTTWLLWLGRALRWTDEGGCVFMKDEKCSIYEARPEQCRTWPYWKRIIQNREDLLRARTYCKGIE